MIDNLGQNLVDQVFYEKRVSYLVVEVTDKHKEAFLLESESAASPAAAKKGESTIDGGLADGTTKMVEMQEEEKVQLQENNKTGNEQAPSPSSQVISINLAIYAKCSHCYEFGKLSFNCPCHKVNYCSRECQTADQRFHEEKCQGIEVIEKWDQSCKPNKDARLGLTGIRNLNNSCYLSSSLQCLSHAIGLSQYFLRGRFKEEINYTNPLGTQGKLAIGFAKLMKQLWFDAKESVAPLELKNIIAKFKKQFNNQD